MGSYQILGRFAKMQNAYNIRILRPARQPVFFYFTVATFLTKKIVTTKFVITINLY